MNIKKAEYVLSIHSLQTICTVNYRKFLGVSWSNLSEFLENLLEKASELMELMKLMKLLKLCMFPAQKHIYGQVVTQVVSAH